MKKALIYFLCHLLRLAIRLRYKVRYKGLNEIKSKVCQAKKGVLFLPNHPAVFIDPLVVALPLLPSFSVRPLIIEYMFYHPLVNWAARMIRALPVPNFSTGFNPIKQKRTEKILAKMSEGLQQGERFIIYPSGTTKQGPKEILGGAFGAHQLVQENPEAEVVLVRMTGLWGSMFSRALSHGDAPNMTQGIKKSVWILIKNMLLFTPRREVTVEFELAPADFPKKAATLQFNRYLEEWYNKPFEKGHGQKNEGEPLSLVSYAFWKEELPIIHQSQEEVVDLASISDDVKEAINTKVNELAGRDKGVLLPTDNLLQDLGLDSLDLADLVLFLENRFDVSGISPGDLTTVARLYLIACKIYKTKDMEEPDWDLSAWNKKEEAEAVFIDEGETIGEVFLKVCDRKLFDIACADFRSGIATYRDLKMKALLIAEKIRKLPGERIGILLPSSMGVEVLILGCLFANKTPVMINWTVGGRHLDTVVEVAKIEVVLTSWSFLDNLENVDISRIEEMLVVLEELKVEISFFDVVQAHIASFFSSKRLLKQEKYAHMTTGGSKKEAVVLFTSGTEAMPKGVPLTHKNILSNQRAVLGSLELFSRDRLLAMLPPFHSFGFVITGLLPLLAGIKAVYYPNPTDSKRLAKAIRKWGITILASAPTFIKNIFHTASKEQLSSLRLIVSGAEKAPNELFSLASALCPQAAIFEGYGITECSPVLSVNTKAKRECGVGLPISGVQFKVVHPEDLSLLAINEVGLVLASGPNIFPGYLNMDTKSPFIDLWGTKWYQTGDLGRIDEDGNLILAGRMKRFVKVGGEMISLVAIEEALSSLQAEYIAKGGHESKQDLPQFAVVAGKEEGVRPKLVLFTTVPLEVLEVNQTLRQKGFSNLVKIDSVRLVEEIPVTATGKVSYRALDAQLREGGI
jgi:long-chain-fatty-acid--[acyl-carrier-protein] ligase